MEKNRGSKSSIVDKHGVLSKRKLRSESAADDLSDINDAEVSTSRFFFFLKKLF